MLLENKFALSLLCPNYFLFLPHIYKRMTHIFLYFDPGTGALIVQLLVAAGASVALFYKKIAMKLKSVFGKKQEEDLMGDIDIEDKKDAENRE